jgi:arylsulfatase A-like enzyme
MVNDITSANDILPTLACLAGCTVPSQAEVEGINICKAVMDGDPLGKRTLYWRTKKQFALRIGDWKLIYTGKSLEKGTHELYNLANDPNETQDVANDNHEIVNEMFEELIKQAELDMIL